jgi:hypothetical protein
MFIKEQADPVGKPQVIESVESLLDLYMRLWDENKNKKSAWKSLDATKITNFLMKAVDDFIVAVDASSILGKDKKATVLLATDRLYDYIVREAMPIWMVPFASVVKRYVVYVLVSNAIDWIVSKYKDGWKPRTMRSWELKKPPCRRRK